MALLTKDAQTTSLQMRVGSPYRTKSTQSELAHVTYLCRRSDRACLTKTHKRLAVVYQPATFVEMRHDPGLMLVMMPNNQLE